MSRWSSAWRRSLAVAIAAGSLSATQTANAGRLERVKVPDKLIDVNGAAIDVDAVARAQRLFFVTLKATWCPICQLQLQRLNAKLDLLRSCGATFVVLAPGPQAELLQIAKQTAFPYPFVEDVELAVAGAAGLRLAADQIEPAIFEVDVNREIVWMDRGRSSGRYNDEALLSRLECRVQTARRSAIGFLQTAWSAIIPWEWRSVHWSRTF